MNAKRNSDEAIKRRVRAGRLLLAGKSPPEVARLVGAPRQTVYRWREVLDASGIDALRNMSTGAAARTWRSGIVAAICDAARGCYGTRLRHSAVDAQAGTTVDRARVRRTVQRGPRLALARATGLVQPEARSTRPGTRRSCHPALAQADLASAKKNAARQGRLIVFIDESGVSERPTRVRTWG